MNEKHPSIYLYSLSGQISQIEQLSVILPQHWLGVSVQHQHASFLELFIYSNL